MSIELITKNIACAIGNLTVGQISQAHIEHVVRKAMETHGFATNFTRLDEVTAAANQRLNQLKEEVEELQRERDELKIQLEHARNDIQLAGNTMVTVRKLLGVRDSEKLELEAMLVESRKQLKEISEFLRVNAPVEILTKLKHCAHLLKHTDLEAGITNVLEQRDKYFKRLQELVNSDDKTRLGDIRAQLGVHSIEEIIPELQRMRMALGITVETPIYAGVKQMRAAQRAANEHGRPIGILPVVVPDNYKG